MGGKSAPKAPDPKATAAAQTGTNVTTAIANGYLGNINQITPDGNLSYSYGGMKTVKDPTTGATYRVPTTTVTQTLSKQQQAIKNQQDIASKNLATTGANQSARLDGLLSTPFNLSGAPAAGDPNSLQSPSYQQFFSGSQKAMNVGAGPLQNSFSAGGNIQKSLGNTGTVQTGLAGAGKVTQGIANAGGIQGSVANAGSIQSGLAGAGAIGSSVADAGKIQNSVGNAGDITRSYDVNLDTSKYEDALMQRMNPQLAQNREALETKLVNQGLQPGSVAFDRAIDAATRQENDARFGAILNAGQEQSRLVGLSANQAAFENSAQQQAYQQALASGQFTNTAQAQKYGQNANNLQLANAAQAQQFGQNVQAGEFANSAQAQKYSQNANNMQQANAAQAQQYQQNANNASFANAAQSQQFGQNLSAGQFANSAQAQQLQNALASGQFANAAQQQQYAQNQGLAQFGNEAQQQRFTQDYSNAQLYNSADQQQTENYNAAVAGNNTLQDQRFNAQQAKLNAQNQARATYQNEQYALRNQPLNEISALMSGGQVTSPQFVPTQGQSMPTVDYAGLVNQKYQNDMAGYQQSQAGMGAILGGLGGLFSLSDKTAKEDIKKVGSLDGHGLYRYRYKGQHDDGRQHIGVMAQDVKKTRPDAVARRPDGKLAVNYGALFNAGA